MRHSLLALLKHLALTFGAPSLRFAGSADVGSKSSSNIKSSSGDSSANDDGTPSNRVLGGHKAAIHNDSVPEESKERSRQVLKDAGVDAE